jgi:hypothetical protein
MLVLMTVVLQQLKRSATVRFTNCCPNSLPGGALLVSQPKLFKYRHFEAEIILLCLHWYLRYSLSYRDLEEMMAERGLFVDHTSIYRWVQHYAPLLERRCRTKLKMTNSYRRVDETYIKAKGQWCYLYRAVDSGGNTIEFMFSPTRNAQKEGTSTGNKKGRHPEPGSVRVSSLRARSLDLNPFPYQHVAVWTRQNCCNTTICLPCPEHIKGTFRAFSSGPSSADAAVG